jgi:hypothetical protein
MKLLGWLVPWWAWGIMAAVALSGAFGAGWKVEGWRWTAHEAKALKQAEARFQKQLDKQQAESESYEQSREHARVGGAQREEAIRTVYRTIPAPPAVCEPPADVRSVLQAELDAANARLAGQPQG